MKHSPKVSFKTLIAGTAAVLITSAAVLPTVSHAQDDGASLFTSKACVTCHGVDGKEPTNNEIPIIGGQNRNYLVAQITNIRSGERSSGNAVQMKGIAQALSDSDIEKIADYLSSLPSL